MILIYQFHIIILIFEGDFLYLFVYYLLSKNKQKSLLYGIFSVPLQANMKDDTKIEKERKNLKD